MILYVHRFNLNSAYIFPYHNLVHINEVVEHTNELATHYQLNELNHFIVKAAAWFHDLSHLQGVLEGHEEASVKIMREFFSVSLLSNEDIAKIETCILATRRPPSPQTLLEMILCDADTWHVGTLKFRETDSLVKEEMEQRLNQELPLWHQSTLTFLETHTFFTEFCRVKLEEGKNKNIEWLKRIMQKNHI